MTLKDYTVTIVDYGNFFYIAERLAKDFRKVYYYMPWESAFPRYNSYVVGTGVPNVERIYNLWDHFDETNLFYFPDLYQGALQNWLRQHDKLVFGAARGEEMEIYRDRMKYLQGDLGLPVNEFEVILGLDDLREYLKEPANGDLFVKTNLMRGHFETFHHEVYDLTKPLLDEMEHTLGIYKDEEVFIVEKPVEAIAEVGYDGLVVDGVMPSRCLFGIEIKDCGYCGVMLEYNRLPEQVKKVNQALSEQFFLYNYRGFYSNEIRIGIDRKGYLIDQTCRQPEPPTSLQLEIYENFSEIIWQVAQGIVPEIKAKYKYGVQIVIKSDWAKTEPQAIYFPPQYKDFVKIKNLAIRDGVHYYIPQGSEMEEIGGVIGMGNTIQEAIDQAVSIAKEIKGYCIHCNIHALQEAQEEIKKLEKAGIRVF